MRSLWENLKPWLCHINWTIAWLIIIIRYFVMISFCISNLYYIYRLYSSFCSWCTLLFVCLLVVSFCKAVADYGNKNAGVFVMSTEDYLTNFYPTIQTALDLYYSLAAVNAEGNEMGKLSFILDKFYGKLLINLFYAVCC